MKKKGAKAESAGTYSSMLVPLEGFHYLTLTPARCHPPLQPPCYFLDFLPLINRVQPQCFFFFFFLRKPSEIFPGGSLVASGCFLRFALGGYRFREHVLDVWLPMLARGLEGMARLDKDG